MTDLYEMNNSANEWLKMIETKMLVDKWMLLRTKIIPTIWLHKNMTITKVIGGFVRTREVPILSQCSADLTSNKHCLPCSNWKRERERRRSPTKSTMGHRVLLLLHGGVGKVLGGLLIPLKVTMEMNQVLIEQGDLLYKCLEQFFKASRHDFSWLHLLCYRWIVLQLTAVYCNRRVCKYHTSNDIFRRGKNVCKITTGKSYDELLQHDNKMRNLGTKWKFRRVEKSMRWVTKHNANANGQHPCLRDTPLHGRQWQHSWLRGTARCVHLQPHPLSVVRTFLGSVVVSSSSRTHALWLKFESFMSSPWPSTCVRSLWVFHVISMAIHMCAVLILPFYFLLYLPPLFLFLNYLKSVVNLHNSCNESMGLYWRVLPLHTE